MGYVWWPTPPIGRNEQISERAYVRVHKRGLTANPTSQKERKHGTSEDLDLIDTLLRKVSCTKDTRTESIDLKFISKYSAVCFCSSSSFFYDTTGYTDFQAVAHL